jgi:hypothetical protein
MGIYIKKTLPVLALLTIASALVTASQTTQVSADAVPFKFDLFSYSPSHSLVYSKDEQLFVKGTSSNFALLDRSQSQNTPVNRTSAVGLAVGETLIDIEVGYESNMFLTSNGRLLTSGINKEGQIGNDTIDNFFGKDIPVNITSFLNLTENETIIEIIASKTTPEIATVITSDHRVLLWGANPVAVSVDPNFTDYAYNVGKNPTGRTDVELFKTPQDVTSLFTDLTAGNVIDLVYRSRGGLAITDTQAVITWGQNVKGVLGNNDDDFNAIASTPIKIDLSALLNENELIEQAILTENNTFLLTTESRVLVWGDNTNNVFVKEAPTELLTPTLYDLTEVTLEDQESVIDMIGVDWGLILLTNQGSVWFKGYTPLLTYASPTLDTQVLADYRANITWLNQTHELPILAEGEKVINVEGFSGTYLFITSLGNLVTQYYFGSPNSLSYGPQANRLVGQFDAAIYRIFIGDSNVSALTATTGQPITLPTTGIVAPEGTYFAGWSIVKNATSVTYAKNQAFNYPFDTHGRFYPVFLQGTDPNEPSSSSSSSSSSNTTSNPGTSLPSSSQDGGGGTPTPRNTLVPTLLITTTIGVVGTFFWLFFFRNFTIGGFSFVALKKWWIAFKNRKNKNKE